MDYDYTQNHAPGASNFSPSPRLFRPLPLRVHPANTPTDRLPTISAAQALSDLNTSATRCLSTGLLLLDAVLQNRENVEEVKGGVSRGGVTEVYGPSGVGKTAFGVQIAAGVLFAGDGVVWVDCAQSISGIRLAQVLSSYQPPNSPSNPVESRNLSGLLKNLAHFSTPTLAHLLALISTTSPTHPPPNTRLIVIDSLPTLISNAFPRSADSSTPRKPGVPNPSARKFPLLQGLISSLQKLAATRNLAVVVTSQCVTKMRPGAGAVLLPAIQTTAWEQGLTSRIALFRDWGWEDSPARTKMDDVRLARVVKAEGVIVPDARVKLVGFSVEDEGIIPLPLLAAPIPFTAKEFIARALQATTPSIPQKRKNPPLDLDAEIPDSDEDDEDYGWAEEDEEELPPLPPQWQGSEDVLLAPGGEDEEQTEEERDEELDFAEPVEEQGKGEEANKQKKLVIDDSEDELAL